MMFANNTRWSVRESAKSHSAWRAPDHMRGAALTILMLDTLSMPGSRRPRWRVRARAPSRRSAALSDAAVQHKIGILREMVRKLIPPPSLYAQRRAFVSAVSPFRRFRYGLFHTPPARATAMLVKLGLSVWSPSMIPRARHRAVVCVRLMQSLVSVGIVGNLRLAAPRHRPTMCAAAPRRRSNCSYALIAACSAPVWSGKGGGFHRACKAPRPLPAMALAGVAHHDHAGHEQTAIITTTIPMLRPRTPHVAHHDHEPRHDDHGAYHGHVLTAIVGLPMVRLRVNSPVPAAGTLLLRDPLVGIRPCSGASWFWCSRWRRGVFWVGRHAAGDFVWARHRDHGRDHCGHWRCPRRTCAARLIICTKKAAARCSICARGIWCCGLLLLFASSACWGVGYPSPRVR